MNPCILIPVYNHAHGIERTILSLEGRDLPVLLIDDGSGEACRSTIDGLDERFDWVCVLRHPFNRGKGAAVKTGFDRAFELGFSHALQIDADGQHDLAAIGPALEAAARAPECLILGHPIYDRSIPKLRLISRYLTHFWVWVNTLSFDIRDAMCGFRVYPLESTLAVVARQTIGDRMDFDIDIAVALHWHGVPIREVEVVTRYPEDGVSHFRMLKDNWLITKAHTRNFFGMLWRAPRLLKRRFA